MTIEEARADWIRVRGHHRDFAELLKSRLSAVTKSLGIYAEISAREKETHSLVKKLIKKPHLSYETLPDKVGARVVVRLRSELAPVSYTHLDVYKRQSRASGVFPSKWIQPSMTEFSLP